MPSTRTADRQDKGIYREERPYLQKDASQISRERSDETRQSKRPRAITDKATVYGSTREEREAADRGIRGRGEPPREQQREEGNPSTGSREIADLAANAKGERRLGLDRGQGEARDFKGKGKAHEEAHLDKEAHIKCGSKNGEPTSILVSNSQGAKEASIPINTNPYPDPSMDQILKVSRTEGQVAIPDGLKCVDGSLVKTDFPISLGNFQEVIAKAMKEAMAIQLNDWFVARKKEGEALAGTKTANTMKSHSDESASQASHEPTTVAETPFETVGREDQIGEMGSSTREIAIEACEQLSRERRQAGKGENEQEREVISPDTTKKSTTKDKEATRTSIRQYQKRGGKPCSRGETVARAEIRKQTHLSPGMRFTLFDFLSDEVLLYMAKSCGIALVGNKGVALGIDKGWLDRSALRPIIGAQ